MLPIEVYRVQGRWLTSVGGYYFKPVRPWCRTWQAEWDGCKRAPRAFTRWGIYRKACRRYETEMRTY